VEAGFEPDSEMFGPSWGMYGAIGVLVLWVGITLALMVHLVGQREVAIVYNFSGTIAGKRDAGTTLTAPWQHVKKENVGIQHTEYDFGQNNSAVSRDQQKIFARLAVNYQIDAVNVVDLYKRVGPSWKDIIIEARVPQVFKEVTATFPTPKITEERAALREQTRTRLIDELDQYDIKVVDVFITNLGFSDQYSQAIEEKQQQVQDAQRAEAKVKQVEAEARQKVAAAEGEAKSNIARARGEARANRLRSRSLTPAILKLRAIETLNDNVQIIVCPPQSVCIPNSGVIPNPGGN
jgi:regulator of protease activity HflC (stomatin/prohibitin superfamily)